MTGILNTSRSQVGKPAPGEIPWLVSDLLPLPSWWHPPLHQSALCL